MQISEGMGDSPAHASFPTRSRADNAGSAGGRSTFGRLPAERANRSKQFPQLRGAAKRRARPQSERAATQQDFAAFRAARLRGSRPRPKPPATQAVAARWQQDRKQARFMGQPSSQAAAAQEHMLRALGASHAGSDLLDGSASGDDRGAAAAASRRSALCAQRLTARERRWREHEERLNVLADVDGSDDDASPSLALHLRGGGRSRNGGDGGAPTAQQRAQRLLEGGDPLDIAKALAGLLTNINEMYGGRGAAADRHRVRLRTASHTARRLIVRMKARGACDHCGQCGDDCMYWSQDCDCDCPRCIEWRGGGSSDSDDSGSSGDGACTVCTHCGHDATEDAARGDNGDCVRSLEACGLCVDCRAAYGLGDARPKRQRR